MLQIRALGNTQDTLKVAFGITVHFSTNSVSSLWDAGNLNFTVNLYNI